MFMIAVLQVFLVIRAKVKVCIFSAIRFVYCQVTVTYSSQPSSTSSTQAS